jgi:hypothetical protein
MANNQPGAEGSQIEDKTLTPPPGGDGGEGNAEGSGQGAAGGEIPDGANWDEKTRKYIASLRDESAKYRKGKKDLEGQFTSLKSQFDTLQGGIKKAIGLEEDNELTPEERVQHLSQAVEGSNLRMAVLENALAHGLNIQQTEYFEFLMGKELAGLEEGQELDDEAMEAIIAKAKGTVGGQPPPTSTSVGSKGGAPDPNKSGEISVEQFGKMTLSERSRLHQKNPELYTKLFQEAKAKKLI